MVSVYRQGRRVILDRSIGMSKELYTPDMVGSGQFSTCAKCGKEPTKEGHDGCIGTLQDKSVMNACCGHGQDSQAYVQFWGSSRISGQEAINYINENKSI